MRCEKCYQKLDFGVKINFCPFCGVTIVHKSEREALRKSMLEQRCPICDKAPLSESVCPEYGYDQSSDAETFGTLCAVLPVNKKTLAEQMRVYEEQRMITSRKLLQQTGPLSAPEEYSPLWEPLCKKAEQGDAASQDKLGDCYYWGKNVAKDYGKAVDWYRKAAQQGYASAQYHLGECYYYGKGVVQKYNTAVEWYRKAAQQGYASAQYSLANCYYNGRGIQRDLVIAAGNYLLAKKQGNPNAEAAYSRLLKEATILDRKKLAKHGHILVTTKTTGRLSCKYSEMKEIPAEELTTPVSLIAPNNKKYMFDHLDTVTVSNTEYLVVAQPVSETAQLFFIFKKPEGTANHPIFISEGKAMRRAYRSFQERHAEEIDFDDLLEYSVPAATPKKTGGAKHFAQSSAAHQFKDHDSIPEIIEINSKYQIVDSFVFRQVCKGRKAVKQVIIPRTIQKIEANAFAGLVIEEKIVIPHSVSYIGKNAFTLGVNGIVDCEAGSMAYSFCVQNGLRNAVDVQRFNEVQKFKEAGVCQYCGSHFKGLFRRRCSNPNCNKPKDY